MAIIKDENSTRVQKYKAAAILYAPKILQDLPKYVSYVKNMPLTNRMAAEMGMDNWKFAEKTVNDFLDANNGAYPTFSEFTNYVYQNIRKAYDTIVAKIGKEPKNPMNLDVSKIDYYGSKTSLSARTGNFLLESSHTVYGDDKPFYIRNFEKEYGTGFYLDYIDGYTLNVRIEFSPEIDYTSFAIHTKNPKISSYVGKGKMYRAISVKVYCPAFGNLKTDPESCLIGSTPDISKSAIKYNLPVLRAFKAMLDPKKQKVVDLYSYRAYDDAGISGIHVHSAYFYVRNAKNWDEADKKVLAYINSDKYDANVSRDLRFCGGLARRGIIHGVSIIGNRVVAPENFTRERTIFTDDVIAYSDYYNPVGSDLVDFTDDDKTFKEVRGKFYDY